MSEMSEKARSAAKSKAERLVRSDPHQRTDASNYAPDGPLDGDIQTGPRPISRRQFRRGGKVAGEAAPARADRKPRANGGRAAITPDSLLNANVKEANEDRAGTKHIGGMKKGGRIGKLIGGPTGSLANQIGGAGAAPTAPAGSMMGQAMAPRGAAPTAMPMRPMQRATGGKVHASGCECAKCGGGRVGKKAGGAINDGTRPVGGRLARKGGGRTKKGTNVNIIITQPQPKPPMPMPPPGAGAPPGMAIPPPPPQGAMPPPGGPPPGAMMPRKSGGRAYPIDAGAGSGLGRLEKAERAART